MTERSPNHNAPGPLTPDMTLRELGAWGTAFVAGLAEKSGFEASTTLFIESQYLAECETELSKLGEILLAADQEGDSQEPEPDAHREGKLFAGVLLALAVLAAARQIDLGQAAAEKIQEICTAARRADIKKPSLQPVAEPLPMARRAIEPPTTTSMPPDPLKITHYLSGYGPQWEDHAACNDFPSKMFIAPRSNEIKTAKLVCGGCEVQGDCLLAELRQPSTKIAGGFTPEERQAMPTELMQWLETIR